MKKCNFAKKIHSLGCLTLMGALCAMTGQAFAASQSTPTQSTSAQSTSTSYDRDADRYGRDSDLQNRSNRNNDLRDDQDEDDQDEENTGREGRLGREGVRFGRGDDRRLNQREGRFSRDGDRLDRGDLRGLGAGSRLDNDRLDRDGHYRERLEELRGFRDGIRRGFDREGPYVEFECTGNRRLMRGSDSAGYMNRDQGRWRDRDQGALRDRVQGALRDRDQGTWRDRDQGALRDRDQGALRDRDQGALRDRVQGALRDRDQGALRDRDQGYYMNRDRDQGTWRDRDQGYNNRDQLRNQGETSYMEDSDDQRDQNQGTKGDSDQLKSRGETSYMEDSEDSDQYRSQSQQSFGSSNQRNKDSSQASDEQLAKDVQYELSPGYFSKGYEQVKGTVRNGDVTLTGTVPSQKDKENLEKDIRKIQGVRDVKNNLRVVEASYR